jgi:signal peptidase II
MIQTRRMFFTFLVIVTCIGCDQATKTLASRKLVTNEPVELIGNSFYLEYTENTGAMMGVGSELPGDMRFLLFTVFAGFALSAILAFTILEKKLKGVDVLSLAMILGGGMSNLLDRLLKGGIVVDFMIVSIGSIKTAIFNFADLSIVLGLVVLAVSHLPFNTRRAQATKKG